MKLCLLQLRLRSPRTEVVRLHVVAKRLLAEDAHPAKLGIDGRGGAVAFLRTERRRPIERYSSSLPAAPTDVPAFVVVLAGHGLGGVGDVVLVVGLAGSATSSHSL